MFALVGGAAEDEDDRAAPPAGGRAHAGDGHRVGPLSRLFRRECLSQHGQQVDHPGVRYVVARRRREERGHFVARADLRRHGRKELRERAAIERRDRADVHRGVTHLPPELVRVGIAHNHHLRCQFLDRADVQRHAIRREAALGDRPIVGARAHDRDWRELGLRRVPELAAEDNFTPRERAVGEGHLGDEDVRPFQVDLGKLGVEVAVERERQAVELHRRAARFLLADMTGDEARPGRPPLGVAIKDDVDLRGRPRHVGVLPRPRDLVTVPVQRHGDDLVRLQLGAEVDLGTPRRRTDRRQGRAVDDDADRFHRGGGLQLESLFSADQAEVERQEDDHRASRA